MEKKKKNKILNLLICFLVFIIVISFPFNLFIKSELLITILGIALRILFIGFIFIFNKKENIVESIPKRSGFNSTLFVPLFLVCFCNIFYLMIINAYNPDLFKNIGVLQGFSVLFAVFAEEILFRFVINNNIIVKNKLVKFIICGAIFGLSHLVALFNGFNVLVLVQVVYSFGLGVLLSFIYEYSGSLILVTVFHFLFNFMNMTVYENSGVDGWDYKFVLVAIIVSLFALCYSLIVYFKYFKALKSYED